MHGIKRATEDVYSAMVSVKLIMDDNRSVTDITSFMDGIRRVVWISF